MDVGRRLIWDSLSLYTVNLGYVSHVINLLRGAERLRSVSVGKEVTETLGSFT